MVMYLPPRSSSSGTRSIRRELQRRRSSKPLAPTRPFAKKPCPSVSPPPRHGSSDAARRPCPRPPHREVPSSTTSHSRGSTVSDASPQPRLRASSRCCTPAASPPPLPPSSASSSRGGGAAPGVVPAAHLKPGTVVRVRTRTATLKTGQVLVLCLKATIVSSSSADGGGYEVVYDANWPRGDPKSTVRVALHQIKMIDPSPSPATPPPPSLPPPTATKEMPRPTTAGKSLRLVRSLFPEMELPA